MEKPASPVPPLERQVLAGAVPTVWLFGRSYSNAHLRDHPELIGTTLSLRLLADDLTRIECFTQDGQELPALELLMESTARRMPAPAKREYLMNKPRLGMTYSEDAMAVYLKHLAARKASTSRDST